jgi:polyhydroxybutyrate depolymerase
VRPYRLSWPVAVAAALAVAACGSSSDPPSSTPAAAPASATAASASSASSAGGAQQSPACAPGAKAPPSKVAGAPLDTILRVPARARGHRAPLILALHFASGTGAQMEQATRYTPQAARSGFAVAYPTASADHFWSIDGDFDKLAKTLDAVERVACIDPSRVYVSGISNGGFMATVLACRMANRIAAAALFAPAVSGFGDCSPARPISVLEVHGTSDPIVPYRDGRTFIAAWAARDGCRSHAVTSRVTAKVSRLRWPGCRGGATVQHLRLDHGRHIQLFGDLRRAGVDPAATAWRFLARYRHG